MAAAKHREESAAPCSCCPSVPCCLSDAITAFPGQLLPLVSSARGSRQPRCSSWLASIYQLDPSSKAGPVGCEQRSKLTRRQSFPGKKSVSPLRSYLHGVQQKAARLCEQGRAWGEEILISFSSICSEIALRPVFCRTWSVLNLLPFPSGPVWLRVHAEIGDISWGWKQCKCIVCPP